MKVEIYKALWGMTGSLASQIEQVAAAGYDGVEVWPEFQIADGDEFRRLIEQTSLKVIAAAMMPDIASIQPVLDRLQAFDPVKINLQSGRDSMTLDEGSTFLEAVLTITMRLPIPVLHETHRGKVFYAPWTTAIYLKRFPEVRITADYSHWVNVCERLPLDQADVLQLANARAGHIHGRVGYEEGPQVPHPAAPEYATQLEWHESQWRAIYDAHIASESDTLTFTPEYGPPAYLHTLPYTNAPVADLWEVCQWATDRARQLFA